MKHRVWVAMIVVGVAIMGVAIGQGMTRRGNEFTMYYFGLGGLLTTIGIGASQRRR